MSWRTIYNPAAMLSFDTRAAIREAGVSLDNYASNIAEHLSTRGRDDLVKKMVDEIGMSQRENESRRDQAESHRAREAYDRKHRVGKYLDS